MKISEMIAVLEAAEKGAKIEWCDYDGKWYPAECPIWAFDDFEYRIAPKKEMTLVEELRMYLPMFPTKLNDCVARAADRIEELEKWPLPDITSFTASELSNEIGRRMRDKC